MIQRPPRVGMCFLCNRLPITWKMTCYRDVPGLGLRRGEMAGYCDRCRAHVALQVDLADRGVLSGRIQ